MYKALSFDDVLIVPTFSEITSRKNVQTWTHLNGLTLDVPIISSNMDTITGPAMANAMNEFGGLGAHHRFYTIEENIEAFKNAPNSIVSVGITESEKERVIALQGAGAKRWLIDVAHGASIATAEMYNWMRKVLPDYHWICVGNFADDWSYRKFKNHVDIEPNAIKVGIGGGSMCTTRIVTGCGLPTLHSILTFKGLSDLPAIIADGGIKNSGDIAKALAAGADAVMIGNLLSGTYETPGEIIETADSLVKRYRGSASLESYQVQGKVAAHRSPEGESTFVPYKGPVKDVLQQLKAGLQSAMSYVGSDNIQDFKKNAQLIEITNSGMAESRPHGVKK